MGLKTLFKNISKLWSISLIDVIICEREETKKEKLHNKQKVNHLYKKSKTLNDRVTKLEMSSKIQKQKLEHIDNDLAETEDTISIDLEQLKKRVNKLEEK